MAAAGFGSSDPLEEAGTEDEALDAVKMLLDLGADIDAADNKGDTAMHGCGLRQLPMCVQLPANRGAESTSGNGPTQREGRRSVRWEP